MNLSTALSAAADPTAFTLPDLMLAQAKLEATGRADEAEAVETFLMEQSEDAWEAAGIDPA